MGLGNDGANTSQDAESPVSINVGINGVASTTSADERRATRPTTVPGASGVKSLNNRARAEHELDKLKSMITGDKNCAFRIPVETFAAQARLLAEKEDAYDKAASLHSRASSDLELIDSHFNYLAPEFDTIEQALTSLVHEYTSLEEVKQQWAELQSKTSEFTKPAQQSNLSNVFTVQLMTDEASTRQREVDLQTRTKTLEVMAPDREDKGANLHETQQDLTDTNKQLADVQEKLQFLYSMYTPIETTPALLGMKPLDKLDLLNKVFDKE
jgi:myosin heavy subunit